MSTGQPPVAAMMQMLTGGWVAGAIATAAELRVADALAGGAKTAAEVAGKIGADERALYRLMRFLASVGVLREDGNGVGARFGLTETGQLLRGDAPATLRDAAIFFNSHHCQRPWEIASYSVKTGKTSFEKMFGANPWKYYAEHPEDSRVFNNAMTALASSMHAAAIEAYDFSGFSSIVDVGGGHGHLLASILKKHPKMTGIVFDQPHVVNGSAEVFAKMGVSGRAKAEEGSFFEKVPAGADAYVMSHILHDWDDASCEKILKCCRRASKPGGKVLAFDAVIKGPNEPDFGKLLDLVMLIAPGGRERTESEFGELFKRSGYEMKRTIPTKSSVSIVEGVAV